MFYENLLALCEERRVLLTPTIKALGISPGVIGGWKKGGTPNGGTLLKIANHFNVSVDYLLLGTISDAEIGNKNDIDINGEEMSFLEGFRKLDFQGRYAVGHLLHTELSRIEQAEVRKKTQVFAW